MFGFMRVYENGFVAINYTDSVCDALTLCTDALYSGECHHVEVWHIYTGEKILNYTCPTNN